MIAYPEDRIEFVVFNEGGDEIESESVSPVITFRETEEAWFIDNGFYTYVIVRSPGMTYALRHRAADVSHIIEALEKGKHA